MKTPLYKRYADRRPVGSVCLCNTVHYTAAGRGYLRKGSLRLYLDEIMRV